MSRYSASYLYFPLTFKKPSGTSRGILREKPSWLLTIKDSEKNIEGIGECSIIPGLSIDDLNEIEPALSEICIAINSSDNPETVTVKSYRLRAVHFALETAILDLKGGGQRILFDNSFSRGEKGIPINGLVWMSDIENMIAQARQNIESGFQCIKFKIGALDFESELHMLQRIRQEFGEDIEIRLDANGAFLPKEALYKLEKLTPFNIHSIEQPIKPGQTEEMRTVCLKSPIPVALDEELIEISELQSKNELLDFINPAFIILKPSLLGGFEAADEWIHLAENKNIGWWATSALESNIGLNAIAQWVAGKNTGMFQGLGTGSLYSVNFPLPLEIKSGQLLFKSYSSHKSI